MGTEPANLGGQSGAAAADGQAPCSACSRPMPEPDLEAVAAEVDHRLSLEFGQLVPRSAWAGRAPDGMLDGLLGSGEAFSVSAVLKHGETTRSVSFDDCFMEDKNFQLGAGGHGETVYGFTANLHPLLGSLDVGDDASMDSGTPIDPASIIRVSPSGDDANDGHMQPVKTLKQAIKLATLRGIHIICGLPIIGYIYGPPSEVAPYAPVFRYLFLPVLLLTGLWMWKGDAIARLISKRSA